ncbi:MAG: nucleotidyltransferase [Bacteroidales bacterium]|nr:nucleotidyltransferase [Bacteroidales bacterium]MCL2133395.1 nucleotidyltransferase [Bacteroidales bacterium]
MRPTLLIMAAGMGSRYGGLKQLDGLGPNGEVIMDYSVFDALRADFGKLVFVIRRSMEQDFREYILPRFNNKISVELVFQEIDMLPEGFSCPEGRTKPWGTNHAVMMAAPMIHEPFAVINADDYYGIDSFRVMAEYLKSLENSQHQYCMVGFRLENTLSERGAVSRGICAKDNNDYLTSVVERTYIVRENETIKYKDENEQMIEIAGDTPVSMNIWGFTPDYFKHSEALFKAFLQEKGQELKSEFYIPFAVNKLIQSHTATVKVLPTTSQWFGITYQEDRPAVVERLRQLHEEGVYDKLK